MNKTYRLIWSVIKEAWVVVSEKVSARGGIPARTVAALAVVGLQAAGSAHALPQGGQVVGGSSAISTPAAGQMVINQTTPKSIVNWQSYGIGAGEKVQYIQPSSSAISLNRVTGADPSVIHGQLSANGKVWVINPNGLLIGNGARIEVGGFLGSTLNIGNEEFMNGSYRFRADRSNPGSISNLGNITTTDGGYVMLIAPTVNNEGTIGTNLGKSYLASGDQVTLSFAGNDLLGFTVDKGVLNGESAGIDNSGRISANGGEVILSAKSANDMLKSVVNNSGVIEARTVENRSGRIFLLGDMQSGTVNVGGTLDASASSSLIPHPSSPLDGGFIETSAAHVKIADDAKITTAAANGLAGSWLIDPVDFTIASGGGALTASGIGATTLSNNLGLGNVSIATSAGTAGNGDIFVNSAVNWTANKLTLTAHRNIAINANLNGSGTASLALEYGQNAVAAGNTASYTFSNGAKVSLPAGVNFSTKLGSDGATTPWTVITALGAAGSVTGTDLQGMNGNKNGHYVLGADIDASLTSGWNDNGAGGFYGFAPIGTTGIGQAFTGGFDGLGHTISDLFINRPATQYVGLIGYADGVTLTNIGLVNADVTGLGNVGALAGSIDNGSVSASHAAGGSLTGVGGGGKVGGLVGSTNSSSLSNSYATASVNGTVETGGLVGYAFDFTSPISNSYATGNVTGTDRVGGLVGSNTGGSISNSYASGNVNGNDRVGGFAGYSTGGTISNSYSTGSVTGTTNVGGLIGHLLSGTVTASFWDQTVTATNNGVGTGKTTAEMKQLATFAGWDIDAVGGTGKVWRIYDGYTMPLLRGFLTPLNVTPTYDGSGAALGNVAAYTIADSYDGAKLLGAVNNLTLTSVAADAYVAQIGGFYSNQQGYDLVGRTIASLGSAAGKVVIANPVTWTSGLLTVFAANDIDIRANLNGSGTASLAFKYGQAAANAGNTSTYALNNGAKTALPAGASFSTQKGYDGAINTWTVITSLGVEGDATVAPGVMTLQGMNTNLTGNYVLGADINASATSGWNGGAGFVPVGASATTFTGSFDGLGHTITGLTINRPDWLNPAHSYQGLFGYAGVGSTLRNVGLLNSSIVGANAVGALAGRSDGAISNSYADGGSVTASVHQAGGLVGALGVTGSIGNSYTNVSVSGLFGGGASSSSIGGLVGKTFGGSISNSYATGSVHGGTYVGGLVGQNDADIDTSYASGAVTATNSRGGFIGDQQGGAITNSYWDSATTGVATNTRHVANIAGVTDVSAAPYAQASYTGFDFAGSWRIYEGQTRPLLKSFLTPLTVTANDATTTYSGTGYSGGNGVGYSIVPDANLLGSVSYGGTSQGAINVASYVIAAGGLYSNQRGYDITFVDGTLTIDKAHLTVTADNQSRLYGQANPTFGQTITGYVNGENATSAGVTGSAGSGSSAATALSGVGSYTITGSTGTLNAANYDFNAADGTLTIDKAHLTVTADNQSRLYGQANPTFGQTITGYVNGENATSAGVTGSATGSSAATATSGVGSYTIAGSTGTLNAANYDFTAANGTLTINKAHLTVTADNRTRLYGQANPTFSQTITGFVNGEDATGAGITGSATGSSTATALSDVGNYVITGSTGTLNAANYDFTAANGTLTIDKAHLTVTADNRTRLYGQANPTFSQAITGFVNGEDATGAGVTGSAMGSSAATATSGVGSYAITGSAGTLNAANYDFTAANGTLTVSPAPLNVTANDATKTYDGLAYYGGNGVSYSGFVNGETETALSGALAFTGSSQGAKNAGSYLLTPSGLTSGNYTISYANGSLTVNPAPLTVTADMGSKLYGAPDPILTYTTTGLMGADTADSVLSGTLAREAGETLGSYPIHRGTLAANGNYTLGYTGNILAIHPNMAFEEARAAGLAELKKYMGSSTDYTVKSSPQHSKGTDLFTVDYASFNTGRGALYLLLGDD